MEDLIKQTQEAIEAKDLELAQELMAQIEALKAEQEAQIEAVEEELEVEEEQEEEVREEPSQEESPEQPTQEEPSEPVEEAKEEDEENKTTDGEEETRSLEGEHIEMKELNSTQEEIRSFGEFVKSKSRNPETRNMTTVEGQALIPEDVLALVTETGDVADLRNLVNTIKTNTGSGRVPVLSKSNAVMVSVAELAQNPKLANPEFNNVAFEIETYRGYIPVSQELIDDADYDVAQIVADHIADLARNTANAQISTVLKSFDARPAADLDALKSILNVDLKSAYKRQVVVSRSMFNALDSQKDGQGRYMLQQDVTMGSGFRLFGHEVIVLDDELIGNAAGDQVAFVGDLKRAVAFIDRKQVTVKWTDNDIYGQLLAGFLRFDVVKSDASAGFYVTYGA